MLNYTNIDDILNSSGPLSGRRLTTTDSDLLTYIPYGAAWFHGNIGTYTNSRNEFHVYSADSWVTGNHNITVQRSSETGFTDPITHETIEYIKQPLEIDLYKLFSDLKLTRGNFRIVFNFFKDQIGGFDKQHLKITEISPDRTEVKLSAINPDNPEWLEQITDFIRQSQSPYGAHTTWLLNFGRNQTAQFINSVVIGDDVYVKLYEPLDPSIKKNFKSWIVEEEKLPFTDTVSIKPEGSLESELNKLSGPNWQANYSYDMSSETGLKNWNDLLGSSVQTSQQIIDTYFSGSLQGVELNIDYTDFNNFIFYSSATERVKNFYYKLQLLEYYDSQSNLISEISGSVATDNASEYNSNKTNLISGFDAFEKSLYYESSSVLYTNEIAHENPNVAEITGSYLVPFPKSNSERPFNLVPVTGSIGDAWYRGTLDSASYYDNFNANSLQRTVPEYIRLDQRNSQLDTFVAMLGHHYDILYTYINHMTKINQREENPKVGMPNELLYSVAKQFGWTLQNGNQYQDLWGYVLGTDESGVPLTGSNSVGEASIPGREMTYSVWRRIVNNLPLLLKSKGTERSVRALLSCYGIPESFITIKEFGGPRSNRVPVYEKYNFDYALDLISNSAGEVHIDYNDPNVESIEIRFRTDNVIDNPQLPTSMELIDFGANYITLEFERGTLGRIGINGTVTSDLIELYDGGWTTLLIKETSQLEVTASRAKYGKIIATATASTAGAIATNSRMTLGGSSNATRLEGQLQEFKLYNVPLNPQPLYNHTKAPSSYDGNLDTYDELLFRVPLTKNIDHSVTGSLAGSQPMSAVTSASFVGWSNDYPYDSIEETYYYDGISLAAGTFDDNKIRLEDNELIGTLDVKTRAERSQFDKAPLDLNKLGVYFSPQTMINEDIIAHLGYTELDDYIGDPGQLNQKSYPDLISVAENYWKKYENKNDINAYIKMFSLFDLSFFKQLDQLLPARANKLTGLLIQPNILERSKDLLLPPISYTDEAHSGFINMNDEIAIPSGTFDYMEGHIEDDLYTISGIDDDQLQGYLTASSEQKYGGTIYCREYAIWSGSGYITGSTPYWMCDAYLPQITSSRLSSERESAQYTEYRINTYLVTDSYCASGSSDTLFVDWSEYNPGNVSAPYNNGGPGALSYQWTWPRVTANIYDGTQFAQAGTGDGMVGFEWSSGVQSITQYMNEPNYIFEIDLDTEPDGKATIYSVVNLFLRTHPSSSQPEPLLPYGQFFEYLQDTQLYPSSYTGLSNFEMPFKFKYMSQDATSFDEVKITYTFGSASIDDPSGSFQTIGTITTSAQKIITKLNDTGGMYDYITGSLVFDIADSGSWYDCIFKNGAYHDNESVIYLKQEFEFSASAGGGFFLSNDEFLMYDMADNDQRDSYVDFGLTASFDSTVSIISDVTSSVDDHPCSIWTTTGSFSEYFRRLGTTYDVVPSGSLVTLSLSSSVSASISAISASDATFSGVTGISVQLKKWAALGDTDDDFAHTDVEINYTSSLLTFGSDGWDGDNSYPAGGLTGTYGGGTYNLDLNDITYNGTSFDIMIQPLISGSNVLTDEVEFARACIECIVISYNREQLGGGSGGSIIGYTVVSGSNIQYADSAHKVNGPAEFIDDIGSGAQRSRYDGVKMTSPNWNVSSPDTIDGGPVVEWSAANPNQFIYQSLGQAGSFKLDKD